AVSFLGLSLGLLILAHRPKLNFLSVLLSGLVLVYGGLMVLKYLHGPDFELDQLLFSSKLGINRIAPLTATNFFLSGLSLLSLNLKIKKFPLSQILILLVLAFSLYSFVGYLYSFVGSYGIGFINPVAIHTALGFSLFSLALLVFDSNQGLVSWLKIRFQRLSIGTKVNLGLILGLIVFLAIGL